MAAMNPWASLIPQVTEPRPVHTVYDAPKADRHDIFDAATVVISQEIKRHGPRLIKYLTGPTGLSRPDVTYLLINRKQVFKKTNRGAYDLVDSESSYVSRNAEFKKRCEAVYSVFANAQGPVTADMVVADLGITKSQARAWIYKLVDAKRLVLVELSPQGNKPSTYTVTQ